MSDQATIENKLQALQQKYLASLPEKLSVIVALWQDCTEQMTFKDKALESALHKLAGSAGMYEQDELGHLARDLELIVSESEQTLNKETESQINLGLAKLEDKINELLK